VADAQSRQRCWAQLATARSTTRPALWQIGDDHETRCGDARAQVGAWLEVTSSRTGRPSRRGEIAGVGGAGGALPFRVRWTGDDHEALVFPGPNAEVISARRSEQLDREQAQRIAAVQSAIETRPTSTR
jgi:uncharacterized protein DUF1918